MRLKKYFLILGFFLISGIAALYGVSPAWFARTFFGIADLNVNLAHILRAVMCLYVAFGLFWLISAFDAKRRNTAILTMIVFGSGLFVGRVVSFVSDGWPSPLLIGYAALELGLLPIAYLIYRQPDEAQPTRGANVLPGKQR